MSIKIQVNKELTEPKVHFIPAAINSNGENIKINEYFNQYTEERNEVFINALRGYPINGVEMKVPFDLQGVILRENEGLQIDDAERVLKLTGKFDEFTYWNYDKNPSENDSFRKSLHWLKIAQALHTEVDPKEMES